MGVTGKAAPSRPDAPRKPSEGEALLKKDFRWISLILTILRRGFIRRELIVLMVASD